MGFKTKSNKQTRETNKNLETWTTAQWLPGVKRSGRRR